MEYQTVPTPWRNIRIVEEWVEKMRGLSWKVRFNLLDRVGKPENPVMVTVTADVEGIPYRLHISLQGVSVAILVILKDEHGQEHAVYVEQPRPAICMRNACELIAGRQDHEGNSEDIAIGEVIDEGNLHLLFGFTKEQMRVFLKEKIKWLGGIYSSSGVSSEFCLTGVLRLDVSLEAISMIADKPAGDSHESIIVRICELNDLLGKLSGDPRAYYIWSVLFASAPQYYPEKLKL